MDRDRGKPDSCPTEAMIGDIKNRVRFGLMTNNE